MEDEGVAKKKIGGLLILTPSNANDNLGGASEIMRLVVILVIAGMLWGSVMIKNMLRHSKQAAEVVNTLQQVNPVKK